MKVEFKDVRGVLVARVLERRIDANAAPDLKTQVGAQMDAGHPKVVLDLAEVELVDSTGLGAILYLYKKAPRPSGGFVLCGCRAAVLDLMKLTRMERVFKFLPSEAEAVAALAGPAAD